MRERSRLETLQLSGIGMTSQRTRDRMVERLEAQGIRDLAVLEVMGSTPRHLFLDEALAHRAYEDCALPIGHQQTLSQPYIVARMTELLLAGREPPARVLEIGTGSGYQTAILARLVAQVDSIERIAALYQRARERLQRLKLYNVRLRLGDGSRGWAGQGCYQGILAAAAPSRVPAELLAQLALGGRLVMPVGSSAEQQLIVVDRHEQGFEQTVVEPVRFVPLLGGVMRQQ